MFLDSKNLMILSSIAQCRKAIAFLTEVGDLEATDVVLGSVPCPSEGLRRNVPPGLKGHRIVLLGGSTLVCRDCGKLFHTGHRAPSKQERAAFEALHPAHPF